VLLPSGTPMLHSIDESASSGVSVLEQEYPAAPSPQVTVESGAHEDGRPVMVTVGVLTDADAVQPAMAASGTNTEKSPRIMDEEVRMTMSLSA
jgi:hypothetical protein